MADDRHYRGGDNYILDDLSGFKIRASHARIIPGGQTGGLAVAPERWEPQQPQDFVSGVYDDQTVDLARPRQTNQFVITGTFVTAASAARASTIAVDSTTGFQAGSLIQIMLDTGENFQTPVLSIAGNVMTLVEQLPASVGSLYGDPIENLVLLLEFTAVHGVIVLDTANGILGFNVLA